MKLKICVFPWWKKRDCLCHKCAIMLFFIPSILECFLISDKMESHYPLLFNNFTNESQLEVSLLYPHFINADDAAWSNLKRSFFWWLSTSRWQYLNYKYFTSSFLFSHHQQSFHNDECSLFFLPSMASLAAKPINEAGKKVNKRERKKNQLNFRFIKNGSIFLTYFMQLHSATPRAISQAERIRLFKHSNQSTVELDSWKIFPTPKSLSTHKITEVEAILWVQQSTFVIQFFMLLSYGFTLTKHFKQSCFYTFIYLAIVCLFAFEKLPFRYFMCFVSREHFLYCWFAVDNDFFLCIHETATEMSRIRRCEIEINSKICLSLFAWRRMSFT